MPKLSGFRVAAGAMGLVCLALFLLSLDPFLSAVPFAGAATNSATPSIAVNRDLKGDRLPIHTDLFDATVAPEQSKPAHPELSTEPRAQIPTGCDPAFSQIFSSKFGNVYRRCMT
jgi:hypothetical protein